MTDPTPISAPSRSRPTPDVVWQVVSDLGRMPEFSPELRKAFVIGKPGVGANIIGINRRKAVVWPTTSKVVRWEPGRAVAWKTRESGATWVYELEADGHRHLGDRTPGAAEVHDRYVAARARSSVGPQGHDTELAEGIRTTLERIRATVEAGAGQPDRP